MQYIIHCQRREWYGDENHIGEEGYGRYKNKGGQTFVFTDVTQMGSIFCREEELIANFNAKFNKNGSFFRYEAFEITYFERPIELDFDGENFTLFNQSTAW